MENEIPRLSPVWEHSLTTLLGHDPTSDAGMALRHSIHFQQVHHILDLLCWDQEKLKTTPAQQVYSLDDCGQGLYLRTNQIKQICGLITYMKHLSHLLLCTKTYRGGRGVLVYPMLNSHCNISSSH